jgi:type IV pilus assembly protein PilC
MMLLVGIVMVAWRIRPIRFALQSAILRIPVFGKLMRGVQVARLTRVFGTLLSSGVQIVEAIRVTSNSMENLVYKQTLQRIAADVERGEEITNQLAKEKKLFPAIVTVMVKIGDRTGKLSESLVTAAEFCEKEVDVLTKTLSMLIEPITLLFVGGLVGFIALSIITPIYDLSSGISK